KKWFAFRGRLYLSSYESSSKQSINRYTLGFTLPFLDLDLIDSSPDYGTFLLSNRNIRGVSGRLHFGSLSILATKGESVRSVDGITADDGSVTSGGTFKRNTLGGKIELGTLDGLQLGFGFAKNKDDIESLEESFYKRDDGTVIATPKDNIVLGATARLGLDNQRLVLGAEAAVSIYNSNIIDGPLSKEELEDYIEDELPLDPDALKDIIIINTNIEPLIPNVANVAYQVYMRWFLLGNYLSASYSEIGASFNSLSASFLQNDSKVITLSDNISLFNNQFVLDGGVNIISDNLSEQKETTNTNTNWYAQALIRPRGLPYLKVGYNLNKSEDDLEVKEIEQQMDAMNFGVGYNIYQLPFTTTSIDLSTYFANDKDLTDNSSFDFKRNNYQVVIQNKLKEIPLSTRLTLGNTVRTNNFDEEKNTYFQWGLKNEYALWNGMLKPYLDLRFNTYEEDKYSTYELGTQYQPFVRTTINTSVEFSNNNFDQDDRENYSTFNWRLSIAQRF
ncbi:MAG: hypothetical protein WCX83_03955, partial [Candidatus Cloacimonas sp.]|nr:hypothetical protein [Candidatus Cloacimonadota bacterium]